MQWAQRSRECPLCFKSLQLEVRRGASCYAAPACLGMCSCSGDGGMREVGAEQPMCFCRSRHCTPSPAVARLAAARHPAHPMPPCCRRPRRRLWRCRTPT